MSTAVKSLKSIIRWKGVSTSHKLQVIWNLFFDHFGNVELDSSNFDSGPIVVNHYLQQSLQLIAAPTIPITVLIVDHEAGSGISGVISTFANRLAAELLSLGVDVTVSTIPLLGYDVVHHMIYRSATPIKNALTTSMVTHIDTPRKLKTLGWQLSHGVVGICMSDHTKQMVISALGQLDAKVEIVVPPPIQTGNRRRVRLAFVSNLYSDGRKREESFLTVLNSLDTRWISVDLMGRGLEDFARQLEDIGVTVRLSTFFDISIYQQILETSDAFVYFGHDEGAMSILDAVSSGIPVIVPDIGFHKYLQDENVIRFKTELELFTAIDDLVNKHKRLSELISGYTWQSYAQRHIDIWIRYLNKTR